MISCKEASRLLSERLERRLPFGQRWALRLHLWVCAECRRFARQLNLLRRLLGRARQDGSCCVGHPLPDDARRRIAKALDRGERGRDPDQD